VCISFAFLINIAMVYVDNHLLCLLLFFLEGRTEFRFHLSGMYGTGSGLVEGI